MLLQFYMQLQLRLDGTKELYDYEEISTSVKDVSIAN